MIRFGLGLADSWTSGLDFVLRSSLVLAVAWLLTSLLRRNTASMRHAVWTTGLVAVIAMPLVQTFVPSWRVLPATNELVGESFATGDDFLILPMISPDHHGHWPYMENAVNDPVLMASVAARVAANSESDESTIAAMEAMDIERSDALAPSSSAENSVVKETVAKPKAGSSFGPAVGMLWLIGVVVFCLPMVLGTARIWRLRRASEPVPSLITDEVAQLATELGLSRRVEIVLSTEREMPMTWGLFAPVLLLPASAMTWSSERRRMVLLHELAHIRRWDCLTQLLGQLARALHWFNPLAWLALHRLRIEQERACDDVVLNCGTNANEYASELLSVTARLPRPTWDTAVALAMSRCSRIEQRLKAILDADCERRPMSRRHVLATCGLMLFVACGIAAAQRQVAAAAMPLANQIAFGNEDAPTAGSDAKPVTTAKAELGFDNGDFEGTVEANGYPTSWFPAQLAETEKFLKFQVEESGHGGKRSVSITIDKSHPSQPVYYNWVAKPRGWKPGQALEVSAWVKTENVTKSPSLAVQCWSKENKYLAVSTSHEKLNVTGTKDWTRIAALVLVPPGTDQIHVRAILPMPENGGAKVWFDDFAIAETNAADAKAATRENSAAEQAESTRRLSATPEGSLKQVLDKIAEVSPTPVDLKALNEAAIRGMLQSLNDPYSTLITAEQMKEFNQQLDGKLVGIGVVLAKEADSIVITSLVPNSPALHGGVKARDVIVEINGQPAKELADAVKLIRGPAGTELTLTVRRADKPESFTLKRGDIRVPTVKGLSLDEQGQWRHWLDADQKIAFVQLTMFDQQTEADLKAVLTQLQTQGIKGLVLDLRGNPGGVFHELVKVARLFMNHSKVVLIRGKGQREEYQMTGAPAPFAELPLVLVVDATTGSSAEALSASLKDNGRAIVVGERTFGKGSVQMMIPIGDASGASLKLTTAHLISPSGQSLHRAADSKTWGVDPHDGYFVPLTTEQRAARQKNLLPRETGSLKLPPSVSPEFLEKELADPQLAAALRSLSAKLKTGEFAKTGRPLAEQEALLSQRDELRKQRDELRVKLEQLDRQLGEGR
jgi:carboxyl-terminal processing protease